jgi:hypothetical protein
MVEFSKLIARVQCDEFWETTAETGTTDFFVSNYRIIYVGLALPIKKPTGAFGSGGQLPGEKLNWTGWLRQPEAPQPAPSV